MTLSFKRPTEAGDVIVDAGAAAEDYVEDRIFFGFSAWAYLDAAEIAAAHVKDDSTGHLEVVGMQLLAQALEITLRRIDLGSGFPEQDSRLSS